jgi:hypothetical protein
VKVTSLTGQGWAVSAVLFHEVSRMHSSRGVALVQGELACVQGELFVDLELWFGCLRFLFENSFVSDVSSRCLPKGSDTCLLQVILLFAFLWLSIACWSFFFIRFFSFSFLSCYFMWVFSMHSSRGRLRTMCGSRTGGWSLPGAMSD